MAVSGYGLKTNLDLESIKKVKQDFGNLIKDLQNEAERNVIKIKIQTVNDEIIKTQTNIKGINSVISETNRGTQSLAQNFGNVVSKCSQWALGMGTIYEVVKQVKDGCSFLIDLDTKISNISMITGTAKSEVQGYSKGWNQLAIDMKTTTGAIADGMEQFLRAGKTIDESNKLIKINTELSRISGDSASQTADDLVKLSNSYKMTADGVGRAASQVAKLDTETAASSKGLLTSATYASQTAQQSGMSWEFLLGIISTVQEKSKLGFEAVGRSVKSMLLNMEKIKMGKDGGVPEESVSKLEKALANQGIALRKNQKEWRNSEDIIKDIQAKYANFSSTDKSLIDNLLGGKEQAETVKIIMNDSQRVMENYNKALNAGDYLNQKYKEHLNSTQGAINKLKATGEGMWMDLIKTDTIKGGIESITGLVRTLDLLGTTEKSSGIALLGLSTSFILLVKNTTAVKNAFLELEIIQSSFAIMASRIGVVNALGDAFMMLGTSIRASIGAMLTNPLTWIIAGLGLATAAVITHVKHQADLKQETQDLTTSYKELTEAMAANNVEGMKSASVEAKKEQTNLQNLISNQKKAKEELDKVMNNYTSSPTQGNENALIKAQAAYDNVTKKVKEQEEVVKKSGYTIDETTGKIKELGQAESDIKIDSAIEKVKQSIEKRKEEDSSLSGLIDKYNGLETVQNKNTAQQMEMSNIANTLHNKYSDLTLSVDKNGNAVITNTNLLGTKKEALAEDIQAITKDADAQVLEGLRAEKIQVGNTEMTIDEITKRVAAYETETEAMNKYGGDGNANGKQTEVLMAYMDLQDRLKALKQSVTSASSEVGDYTPKVDENTEKTKKNTEAQKAQKSAIDKVKEATKEYEVELKNLDNIQTQLELNMNHMDETSKKYQNSIMEEINLLQQKNGFLQKGVDLNNSQASTLGGYTSAGGSQLGQQIVNEAERYLGTPYAWGGESPSGFDCSGLVQYAFKNLGIEVGRTTYDQVKEGQSVSRENLQPGDLVFFGDISSPHHVGIYAGGGEMIESPHTGENVRVASVDRSDYSGARRVVSGSSSNASSASSSMPTSMTYKEMVDAAGSKYGIDPNLIAAVIEQESDWKATEKSSAGAVGLMQLMSGTAESMGLSADQRTDPLKNIMAGTKYLSELVSKYGEEKGVALYNTGEYGGGNFSYASSVESKKQGYANGSKSMSTTSADVSNDTDVLSELDSLNSKTEDYQKKMLDNSSKILDLYTKWYESNLKYYDQQASLKDKALENDKENYTYFEKDSNSLNDSSRQYMEKEWQEINTKNAILLQKQEFVENELKRNVYDEKTSAQMKIDLLDIQTSVKKNLNDLHQAFKDWISDQVTYKTQGYKDNIDNYNSQLSLLNEQDSGGSKAKVNLNEQILDQYRHVGSGLKDEIAKVQDLYNKEAYGVTRGVWANILKDLNKQFIENQTEIEKTINTLRDGKISQILDDVDKRLKLINQDLKNIESNSKDVGDNNTSQKLINEMNKASDYVTQLKEYTKAYNDIYKEVSKDGVISSDDQKKIDDARSKIDSVNDALQTTGLTIKSLSLENAIKPFEEAIDRITNQFSKLDYQLSMLSSNNYSDKISLISKESGLNNTKLNNYLKEYETLSSKSAVAGTKEAENLAKSLETVRDKIIEASKESKTLKEELQDASLNAIIQQISKPKDKINQEISNIEFQTSMPSEIQGLLLGNNFNVDDKSDTEKELEDVNDISNIVNNINDKLTDLQANTYDIDTSSITSSIETTVGTTNELLKNIDESVNKINENNNKSVVTKNVYGTGTDLDNAKFIAQKYGIDKLFNFINTNDSGFLWSEHKLTSNDVAVGGTGGGVNGDVELNGATRLPGADRDETKRLIDGYMKSLAENLKNNNSNSDTTTEKTNEQLVKKLDLENTNSSTIAENTGNDVQVTNVQTTTVVKSEEDVANKVNNNINSNFVTMEELTRNVKDVLGSIKDAINSLKDLEDKDLGQIITDLDVIDTKTIIEELTKLHESVNNLGDTLSTGLSTEDKRVPFTPVDAVAMPDYNKDDKNKNQNNKVVNKNAHGNSKLDPSILGDGEGSNKGEELVIHKDGSTELIGGKGYTLVPNLSEDDIVVSHEDTKKVLNQGGIQKVSKYADGNKKVRVFAKSSPPDGDYENASNYIHKVLGRQDIDVINIDVQDDITSSDYVLGTANTISDTKGAKRIDGGIGRKETFDNFKNWVSWYDILANKDDIKTVDNPSTKPDTPTTKTTDNYNKVTGNDSPTGTPDTTDYTKLEDTDTRKKINKDIIDSQNKYNDQLQNGASNVELLETEVDLEEKSILLNKDGIEQLEERKKIQGLSADNLKKIVDEETNLNKEMQESQKKIADLAKQEVEQITAVNDAKNKQLETNIKLIGSTSTKDELENDKRKIEILKDESQELVNQQDNLKDLEEKSKEYLNNLNEFSSDKLSSEDNTQLKDLILKQYKDGYLNAEDQSKLKTLEAKLTKLDPDKSLSLQKIIDLLSSNKDKTDNTKVDAITLKEKIQAEEYNTAQQVIANQKSLDEKQFAQNKKDWSKQLFSVSESDFNQYKTDTVAKLQKEQTEAQESLKSANGEDVLYYQDEIKAKSNEISNISNQNYSDIYDWEATFEKIHNHKINQLEEENQKLQEQETHQKNLLTLAELELKLKDAQNEKSTKELTKDKNGNWQFQYVANQQNVDDLEKQVRDQVKSNADSDKQQKIADEKQYEQDLINTQKEAYDKLVNDQQHILEEKYSDMNYLTQQYLQKIKDQVGGDDSKIQQVLGIALENSQKDLDAFILHVNTKVDEMAKKINELNLQVEKDKPNADTSSLVNGINDVASGKATPKEIQQLNDLLNSPNASDELKQLRTDLFDSTKADEVKGILAKYLPEGTDVNKWIADVNSQYTSTVEKNSASNTATESSNNILNSNPQNTSKSSQTMTKEEYMNSDFRKNLEKEAVDAMNKNDTAKLAEIHKEATDYMKEHGVAQAANGGITPSWGSNDGKLMFVHPDELISSKTDTQNILKAADILKDANLGDISKYINNINASNISSNINVNIPSIPSFNNQQSGGNTTNEIHLDNMTLDCPNVVDGQSFMTALKELPNMITQEANNMYNK